MPKYIIPAKELIKVLNKKGFVIVNQKGSHIKLRKPGPITITAVVPNHRTIRRGTLHNILKMAGITYKELSVLLKE